MTDLTHLIGRLRALDKLFVDLWDFATEHQGKLRDGTSNPVAAMTAIKHAIGGRDGEAINEAADALQSLTARVAGMEEAEAWRPIETAPKANGKTLDGVEHCYRPAA